MVYFFLGGGITDRGAGVFHGTLVPPLTRRVGGGGGGGGGGGVFFSFVIFSSPVAVSRFLHLP